jgi:leucyl-tRNA synthetase
MSTNDDSNAAATGGESRRYPFQQIERKWQKRWAESGVYRTTENSERPKYYVLDMFPYPSGSGLHVGHLKNYVPGDVVGRMMHMRGHNVLHPMGWDAFGQPAEQDAIKKNVNPRTVVPILAEQYRRQMSLLGIGYDWDREINSTDPSYYKWNQWAFLLLLERGLAERRHAPVNWCVNENTVLANEEVNEGKCWRCDGPVIKRDLPQWVFKITAYADKLLEGLDRIDWPEGVKTQQRDWIGRSEGAEFDIPIAGTGEKVRVFTTRVDTVFGMSFVVLSPEHALVPTITTEAQRAEVDAYRDRAAKLSEQDRTAENRERTGVFTGAYAVNPVSGHRVPVYIADYVLAGYGTGAIMAVPAHDTRDFDFARRYNLPTPVVIARDENEAQNPPHGEDLQEAFTQKEGGILVNSGQFSGLPCKVAMRRIAEWMESEGVGMPKVNYRLRDWLVSRQRYWGTPIPIIHCPSCGVVPVPKDQLPVLLPDVENYKPGPDGRSPLAQIPEFVHTACPKCGGAAERETDTMAGSVDSSWYFLRFTSPHDEAEAWDRAAADYWMPVDMYIGGREHAVGHLLYARFFTKVFHDAGLIGVDEPAKTLRNQGMLLAETAVDADSAEKHPIKPEDLPGWDLKAFSERFGKEGAFGAERRVKDVETGGERTEPVRVEMQWLKMSKSKGNSVTPDEMAEKYGADALRLYVLFEAPFEDTIQWSEERMVGTFRFLNRAWDTVTEVASAYAPDWAAHIGDATSAEERALRRRTHQAIAKLTDDIAEFRFNTAVSALMIHADALRKFVQASGASAPAAHEAAETLVKLLSPLAPHIADELWERLGHADAYLYNAGWPVADPTVAAEDEITLVVQINGKLRDRLTLPAAADAKVCEMAALQSDKVKAEIDGKTVRKVVVIPGKLVNIVAN